MRFVVRQIFANTVNALAWRLRAKVGDQLVDSTIIKVARCWRPLLKKVDFIGITGSAGKTTTKELLLNVLSHELRGVANPASLNALPEVAKTVFSVRPRHDFCTIEISKNRPSVMDPARELL